MGRKWFKLACNAGLTLCGVLLVVSSIAGSASAIPPPPPGAGVPEIDPVSMSSALTLLVGGLLIAAGRRRSR
jgi:hypothetical protein